MISFKRPLLPGDSTPLGANLKIWFSESSQYNLLSASILKAEILPKREV